MFVQLAASGDNATGVAGASLTGVTASHGLVCFAIYNAATSAQTLADSSSTTWTLAKALTLVSATIAVFRTTNTVASGTHTVTASFSGGGTCKTILIEDDQGSYSGKAIGQSLTAPGAGNTLVPGGTVGVKNSSVYQIAFDNSNNGGTFQPQPGAFASNVAISSNSAGIWSIANSATAQGGTNPGMAPGTGDSTGADNYGVLSMAFQPGGTQIFNTDQIVFIEDPAGYSPSSATYNGLLFDRSTAAPTPAAALLLFVKSNPWTLYSTGEWGGVYPVVELAPIAAVQPLQPLFVSQLFKPSRRLDDLELSPERDDYRRWKHSVYWEYVRLYAAQLVGYTFTLPDFCDDPWLEWVHPKKSDESAIYPYRQINVFIRGQQFNLFWNQPKPWPVTEEIDTVSRLANYGIMQPWARPAVSLFMPNVIGLPVAEAIGIIENLSNLPAPDITYQNVLYQLPPYAPGAVLVGQLPAPPPVPAGLVIGQAPLPGAVLQFPFFTSLIVSTGLVTLPGQGAATNYSPANVVIGDNTPP